MNRRFSEIRPNTPDNSFQSERIPRATAAIPFVRRSYPGILSAAVLLVTLGISTEAIAVCEPTGSASGFSCAVDGAASGQLFSPASKIVRQGMVLGLAEERRRARTSPGGPSAGLTADFGSRGLTEDVDLAHFGSAALHRSLLESGRVGLHATARAGAKQAANKSDFSMSGADLESLGLFLLGSAGFEDQDETTRENGLETERVGVAGGIDYRSGNLLVGIAIDYLGEDTDFDHNAGDAHNDEVGLQLFGVYYFSPNAYAILGGRVASNDYDISRTIFIQRFNDEGPEDDTFEEDEAENRTDGYKYSFVGGAGYDFLLGQGFSVGLSASLEYERTEIEAYSDDESEIEPGAALSFGHDHITTLTSTLEARLQKAFDFDSGLIVPWVYFRYLHEFEDDSRTIDATQLDSLGIGDDEGFSTEFTIRTNSPDRDYFSVGGGVLAGLEDGWSAFAAYDVLLGHSFRDEQTVGIGLRRAF